MAKLPPSYLKLLPAPAPVVRRPDLSDCAALHDVCQAFTAATGFSYSLRLVSGEVAGASADVDLLWSAPVNPGVGTSPGYLQIEQGGKPRTKVASLGATACSSASAVRLATAINALAGEIAKLKDALWKREAELAAGVPVIQHPREEQHLACRLESALKAGAESLGCQAAALYLLDDATQHLKLRAAWGLPIERLAQPPRELRGAMADLEALLGHAVVLEHAGALGPWKVPEDFPAAVCVPVSSPTMPLGTLWFFCERERPFSDAQTNLAEIVAGRIAADLEREALLADKATHAAEQKRSRAAARMAESQRLSLPTLPPPVEGWHVSGETNADNNHFGGTFHDWFLLPDGSLALAVARAIDAAGCPLTGLTANLAITTVRTAIRSHALHLAEPTAVLAAVNDTLWTTSAGDRFAAVSYAVLNPRNGQLRFASAGELHGRIESGELATKLGRKCPPLGMLDCWRGEGQKKIVGPGDRLILATGDDGDRSQIIARRS